MLGWAPGAESARAWARVLVMPLPREPAARYVGEIVEALKYPTTAGPATDAILDALHDRLPNAPGHKAGLAETLAWTRKTFPGIDVSSPAVCPPPLWRDLACPVSKTGESAVFRLERRTLWLPQRMIFELEGD